MREQCRANYVIESQRFERIKHWPSEMQMQKSQLTAGRNLDVRSFE
jgi:hypothetical protein